MTKGGAASLLLHLLLASVCLCSLLSQLLRLDHLRRERERLSAALLLLNDDTCAGRHPRNMTQGIGNADEGGLF